MGTLPILRNILNLDECLQINLISRGTLSKGGGKILLNVPNLKSFPQITLIKEGKVIKIRGILYSTKVSSSTLNSIIEGVQSIINNYLSDTYIFIDPMNEKNVDDSLGLGISLVAETTTKCYISAENVAVVEGTKQLFSPEE